MSAIRMIAIVEATRRWRELALLGLLVALVTGAAMTATVAADRARSSVDRFLEYARASSASLGAGDDAERLESALRGLPAVDAVAVSSTLSVFVADDPESPLAGTSLTVVVPDRLGTEEPSAVAGVDVDRPLILEGRMPLPGRADEILLLEWMADSTGWRVGERLSGHTLALADIDRIFDETSFPGMNGPTLDLEVVGIGRSSADIAGVTGQNSMGAFGSEELVHTTRHEALWWPPNLAVRAASGANEFDLLPALEAAGMEGTDGLHFAGEFVGGVTDTRASAIQTATKSVDTMAVGLTVFALGTALAGLVIIGQAVVRHVAGAARTRVTLFQLGQPRRATATAVTLPVFVASVAGVMVGAAAAIAASAHFPTGLAHRAEVDPGVWMRPGLVIPIGVLSVSGTTAFCFITALRRQPPSPVSAERSVSSRRLDRLDVPPAAGVGVRLALDSGGGPHGLPTRSAFTALTVAVVAATAAIALTHRIDELSATPARWGWNWSSAPIYVGEDPEGNFARVAAVPGVEGVAVFTANGVTVNGVIAGGFALEPLAGDVDFSVRDGRLPQAPGEVALGLQTLRRLDLRVGDTVGVGDFEGRNERTVTIVGTAVFPYEIAETIDDGAVLLPETLLAITDGETAQRTRVVRYSDDVDTAELESTLAADFDLIFEQGSSPRPPAAVRNLVVTKQVAAALAIFFAALGALAVLHAFVATGRRRRFDLAVLRALGFVRGQIRVAFLVQSFAYGVVAVAIGVPTGLAVGGVVWRAVTHDLGAVTSSTVPLSVIGVVPITLFLVAILSWFPGRSASRRHPAAALRAE